MSDDVGDPTDSARLVIEVVGGLLPGQPEPEFHRCWVVTSAEIEAHDPDTLYELLESRAAQADTYAQALRNPNRLNWVRTDWIWL